MGVVITGYNSRPERFAALLTSTYLPVSHLTVLTKGATIIF